MSEYSEFTLKPKQWFICRGINTKGLLNILDGKIELFNVPIDTPIGISLTIGQSLIGQTISNTKLKLDGVTVNLLQAAPFPQQWSEIYLSLTSHGVKLPISQRAEVIGAPDQGKTTFLLFLGHKLRRRGVNVGWLDLDPGQNTLSCPGTLAYGEFSDLKESPNDWLPIPQKVLLFGSTTPRGLLKSYRELLEDFAQFLESKSPEWILIDTPGYVGDEYAKEIHQSILTIIRPQNLIQLGDEAFQMWCRLLLFRFKRYNIFPTLRVSLSVANRSLEIRKQRREAKYQQLLKTLTKEIDIGQDMFHQILIPTSVGWINHHELSQFHWSENQLCELDIGNGHKYLGKISSFNGNTVKFQISNKFDENKIKAPINLRLGLIWLSNDGKELPKPGREERIENQ